MFIVRKQCCILRIISTDRQTEDLFQKACLMIDTINNDTVVSRIGAEYIIAVFRYLYGSGSGILLVPLSYGEYVLFKFKTCLVIRSILLHIYVILQLTHNICILSVRAEGYLARGGFKLASDNI